MVNFADDVAVKLIVGGTSLGNATLGRLYALHVGVLPIVAVVILRAQVVLARRAEAGTHDSVEPLWPNQPIRNVVAFATFFLLIALFVWIAENIGTFYGAWQYPSQIHAWQIVSFQKITSWFLMVIISFIIVAYLKHVKAETSSIKSTAR